VSGSAGRLPGFEAAMTGDGCLDVELSGDLDISCAAALAARLTELAALQPRQIAFNLAAVGYLDCQSARLITATGRLLPPGRKPLIRAARPAVLRLLQVTGLDAACEVRDPAGGG
jgi:anti-anti-sigma factor